MRSGTERCDVSEQVGWTGVSLSQDKGGETDINSTWQVALRPPAFIPGDEQLSEWVLRQKSGDCRFLHLKASRRVHPAGRGSLEDTLAARCA